MVAEAQGFEPWEDFHPRRFSRPVHSTTLPNLRAGPFSAQFMIRKVRLVLTRERHPESRHQRLVSNNGEIRRQNGAKPSKTAFPTLSLLKNQGAQAIDRKNKMFSFDMRVSRQQAKGRQTLSNRGGTKGQNMTGITIRQSRLQRASLCVIAAFGLAACDENGGVAFPGGASSSAQTSIGVPLQTTTTEKDVERPDIFEVNDRGLWDGRPSLGGAWVAHPDVKEPERALIRNTATGETVVGALFRRERENPGPLLQISSDVAEELGVLPGAPTELYVVALRRQEVTEAVEGEEPVEANPVVADLANPVNVEATPLEPAAATAGATAETAGNAAETAVAVALPAATAVAAAATPDTGDTDDDIVEVNLPPAEPTVQADQSETAPVAAVVALPAATTGPRFQIGVFSVEPNAENAGALLRNAGIPTSVVAQDAGGRVVWLVVSSPAEDDANADATLARIKEAGFVDAVLIEADS